MGPSKAGVDLLRAYFWAFQTVCHMTETLQGENLTEYEDRSFAETPFVEARNESYESYEEPQREYAATSEASVAGGPWHFETPFETGESLEYGEAQTAE